MTDSTSQTNPTASPPPPPPGATTSPVFDRPPLRRPHDDRVIVGVAAGVARYLRVDPVIVRVLFVVLAIFGGLGVVLYGIGWLLIPDDGDTSSRGQTLLDQAGPPGSTGRIAMIVVAALIGVALIAAYADARPFPGLLGVWGFGGIPLLLLAVGGVVLWLIFGGQQEQRPPTDPVADPTAHPTTQIPPAEAGAPASAGTEGGIAAMTAPLAPTVGAEQATGFAYGGSSGYPGYTPPSPAPPPPPRPPRPRSYLGLATLSLAAFVVGLLAALNVADLTDIPAVVVMSAGLAILAGGLLVGAFIGRARWLIAVAAPLLLLVAMVAVVPSGLRFNGGIGERTWTPTTPTEAAGPFRLGMGDAELDLTEIAFVPGDTATYPVTVSMGVGDLRIIVPDDVDVIVDAHVGLGAIDVDGEAGTGGSNRRVETTLYNTTTSPAPTITLDADLNLGSMEVSRG